MNGHLMSFTKMSKKADLCWSFSEYKRLLSNEHQFQLSALQKARNNKTASF